MSYCRRQILFMEKKKTIYIALTMAWRKSIEESSIVVPPEVPEAHNSICGGRTSEIRHGEIATEPSRRG